MPDLSVAQLPEDIDAPIFPGAMPGSGYYASPCWVWDASDLAPAERALLAIMYRHAAGDGGILPEPPILAMKIGLAVTTLLEVRRGLVVKGVLVVDHVRDAAGRHVEDVYRIVPPPGVTNV